MAIDFREKRLDLSVLTTLARNKVPYDVHVSIGLEYIARPLKNLFLYVVYIDTQHISFCLHVTYHRPALTIRGTAMLHMI